jgi:hypothetical protein
MVLRCPQSLGSELEPVMRFLLILMKVLERLPLVLLPVIEALQVLVAVRKLEEEERK